MESQREGLSWTNSYRGPISSRQQASTGAPESQAESNQSAEVVEDDVLVQESPESYYSRVDTPRASSVPIFQRRHRNVFAKKPQVGEVAESGQLHSSSSSSSKDFDALREMTMSKR